MNERLKLLRNKLGLTQQEFADGIGIKRNAITNYEIGRNEPMDAVISLICRTYHVNENWLRTGEGDMFVPDPKDELEALKRKYNLTSWAVHAIERFCTLDPKSQTVILKYMESVVDAIREDNGGSSAPSSKKHNSNHKKKGSAAHDHKASKSPAISNKTDIFDHVPSSHTIDYSKELDSALYHSRDFERIDCIDPGLFRLGLGPDLDAPENELL